jgi:hypothetical protein
VIRLGMEVRQRRPDRANTAAVRLGSDDRLANLATRDVACLKLAARAIEAAMRTARETKFAPLAPVLTPLLRLTPAWSQPGRRGNILTAEKNILTVTPY